MSIHSRTLKLGTRGSDLALTQSKTVAAALARNGLEIELEIIHTAGDRSAAPSFGAIGPQGVFVREIEHALLRRDVDFAVHSYKDLPTRSPAGLLIAAVPERVDPADVLLIRGAAHARHEGATLAALAEGARVGTSSARRQAWLGHLRSDLDVQPLRGNVPTRIRKLTEGTYDAIVLASAGISRLEEGGRRLEHLLDEITIVRLAPEIFVPAPSQGALAIQCRADDSLVLEALSELDDAASRAAVAAERVALACAEGGCDLAFGAYCREGERGYMLTTMLADADGRVRSATVDASEPSGLGEAAWKALTDN